MRAISAIRCSAVVFDLDGTLVDSFPGIEASLRQAVMAVDPTLDLAGLREAVGPPLAIMIARLWPEATEEVRRAVLDAFRSEYNTRGFLATVPYAGVPELLCRLQVAEKDLYVLTNKPKIPTLQILKHLGLDGFFCDILSPDSVSPSLATKSDGAHLLVKRHSLIPSRTLMVGDSHDDLKAAESVGFHFLEAAYGYGSIDENVTTVRRLRLKTPSDLAKVVT